MSPQTVLVVDSEVLVRHAIADYLRSCGYTVVEAATSDEALIVFKDMQIMVDAMLCDIEVDGSMNGFELARAARTIHPGIEIALAGSVLSSAKAAANLCDSGPHLGRPYDPQGVADYIKQLLPKRRTAEG
ncbi:response regulator [Mesorhizobium sp. UC22_110]|uniref:response regulator n=1 Tax=unclassified Mesorhizobium TaxID=325217 RepID=UPI00366FF515